MNCCDFPQLANERIVIRNLVLVTDAYGGQANTWGTSATVWAWIKPIPDFNVSEQFKSGQLQAKATHKMIIRYNTSYKNIKDFAAYSITFDGRVFDILSIKNFDKTLKNYGTEFQELLTADNGSEILDG